MLRADIALMEKPRFDAMGQTAAVEWALENGNPRLRNDTDCGVTERPALEESLYR
jgi:hypothetical protein